MDGYTGGIAGYNSGVIENCIFLGEVRGLSAYYTNSKSYSGGIVGCNQPEGIIKVCYSSGNLTGTSYLGSHIGGGICGFNYGLITQSVNTCVINMPHAGGISGYNDGIGIITQCSNRNSILGNTVGGISYSNSGIIENCKNEGTVSANSDNAGGIAGSNSRKNYKLHKLGVNYCWE